MSSQGNRRVDRILDPAYTAGISNVPDEQLRAMREECEEEESIFSYERRLLHGRLAIIEAEVKRRATGEPARSLIDRLPEILSGEEPQTHRGSFPRLDPPPIFDQPMRRIEKLINDDTLARLPDLADDEISSIAATLEDAECDVSETRASVLSVLDRLIAEVGRRAGGDAASTA